MRVIAMMTCVLALAACGGRPGAPISATGDISRACLAADRAAASPRLCTCVQGVADLQLTARDRARVATFFADPEIAHATKISDTRANDAFWDRYRAFIASARQQCG